MPEQLKTFSQKLHRLEQIVGELEKPDVELEDGIALLEEGVKLHQECQTMLTNTQTKIDTLLQAQRVESGDNSSDGAKEETQSSVKSEQSEATLFDLGNNDESGNDDDGDLPF